MIEILVLSGKGGTGKTSLTAAFAHLASDHIVCDLDVDAPDLHLLLSPAPAETHEFFSGNQAVVRADDCTACGQCADWCQFDAIRLVPEGSPAVVDAVKCEGCKVCVSLCPVAAIDFPQKHCGRWYISETRFAPMVHAQLFPGEENSGRLVALLRQKARQVAQAQGKHLILSDGPPGIGCPAISALSGVSLAVLVTEPTVSGRHDLERVAELCRHFNLPAGVIINKWDINPDHSLAIEDFCRQHDLPLFAEIVHDVAMTEAMVAGRAITEHRRGGLSADIRRAWQRIWEEAAAGA